MNWVTFQIVLVFACLLGSAFFAFVETTFTALRLYQVKELENQISGYERFFKVWRRAPEKILISILLIQQFVGTLGSVLLSRLMEESLGEIGLFIGVSLATFAWLMIGDIVPKTFAKLKGESFFKWAIGILNFFLKVFKYLVIALMWISSQILQFLGAGSLATSGADDVSAKEIEFLIGYGDKKGIIDSEKGKMLQNIFTLEETSVKKIMVPKLNIFMLSANQSCMEAFDALRTSSYSRAPVFDGREDNIIGIVIFKDLVRFVQKNPKQSLAAAIRSAITVPESNNVNHVLKIFLQNQTHMAIILDEHGSVSGIITLEDILEQIVGQIHDEHEKVQLKVQPLQEGGFLMDASVSLDYVSEVLGIEFGNVDSVTLGGFFIEKLQRFPELKETLGYKGFVFHISSVSNTKIDKIKVFKKVE